MATPDYIHGFGAVEEQRLRDQARTLESMVFDDFPLGATGGGLLLELGCGVGAELQILSERCAQWDLVGVEISQSHARAAHTHVPQAVVVNADAAALPFPDDTFDAVITIWVLEHVANPRALLAEARRVLRPGGLLVCSEVDNDTFRFTPEQPEIKGWWQMFCRHQVAAGGDPFIGRELGRLAESLGFDDVATRDLALVASRSDPARRTELLAYVHDLLVSGADSMVAAGNAEQGAADALRAEFVRLADDPGVEFEYHAVRLTCRKPSGQAAALR